MQHLSKIFYSRPVLSLRTGGEIGKIERPIINPDNFRVEGWWAMSMSQRGTFVITSSDIRDIIPKGLVVDDHDAFMEPTELIRLEQVLSVDYQIIGKKVITDRKKKIGKVIDYAVDDMDFYVTQLHVLPSLLRNPTGQQRIIGRSQIIEISDKYIVVKEPTVDAREAKPANAAIAA